MKSGISHSLIYGGFMNIVDEVRKVIEPVILENNYRLDEVLYVKEGNTNFLRVIIDKDGIIDVEDCVKVFRLIDPVLDEVDLIDDSYILDVCSKEKGSV
ncbi:MAG: hypothetical protein E7169_00070 [Firmicutes bacterium]|nr:hypothetical protein [Bacillota bacterium]